MRPQYQFGSLPLAIGLAGLMMAAPIQCTYARGRGGGFAHGGFSREGPAAAGGFASRSGSMAGRERGLESGARGAEASRMEQANRMEQAAHEYHRAYPYAGAAAAWDAGAAGVAAATTGAAIGTAAAAAVAIRCLTRKCISCLAPLSDQALVAFTAGGSKGLALTTGL